MTTGPSNAPIAPQGAPQNAPKSFAKLNTEKTQLEVLANRNQTDVIASLARVEMITTRGTITGAIAILQTTDKKIQGIVDKLKQYICDVDSVSTHISDNEKDQLEKTDTIISAVEKLEKEQEEAMKKLTNTVFLYQTDNGDVAAKITDAEYTINGQKWIAINIIGKPANEVIKLSLDNPTDIAKIIDISSLAAKSSPKANPFGKLQSEKDVETINSKFPQNLTINTGADTMSEGNQNTVYDASSGHYETHLLFTTQNDIALTRLESLDADDVPSEESYLYAARQFTLATKAVGEENDRKFIIVGIEAVGGDINEAMMKELNATIKNKELTEDVAKSIVTIVRNINHNTDSLEEKSKTTLAGIATVAEDKPKGWFANTRMGKWWATRNLKAILNNIGEDSTSIEAEDKPKGWGERLRKWWATRNLEVILKSMDESSTPLKAEDKPKGWFANTWFGKLIAREKKSGNDSNGGSGNNGNGKEKRRKVVGGLGGLGLAGLLFLGISKLATIFGGDGGFTASDSGVDAADAADATDSSSSENREIQAARDDIARATAALAAARNLGMDAGTIPMQNAQAALTSAQQRLSTAQASANGIQSIGRNASTPVHPVATHSATPPVAPRVQPTPAPVINNPQRSGPVANAPLHVTSFIPTLGTSSTDVNGGTTAHADTHNDSFERFAVHAANSVLGNVQGLNAQQRTHAAGALGHLIQHHADTFLAAHPHQARTFGQMHHGDHGNMTVEQVVRTGHGGTYRAFHIQLQRPGHNSPVLDLHVPVSEVQQVLQAPGHNAQTPTPHLNHGINHSGQSANGGAHHADHRVASGHGHNVHAHQDTREQVQHTPTPAPVIIPGPTPNLPVTPTPAIVVQPTPAPTLPTATQPSPTRAVNNIAPTATEPEQSQTGNDRVFSANISPTVETFDHIENREQRLALATFITEFNRRVGLIRSPENRSTEEPTLAGTIAYDSTGKPFLRLTILRTPSPVGRSNHNTLIECEIPLLVVRRADDSVDIEIGEGIPSIPRANEESLWRQIADRGPTTAGMIPTLSGTMAPGGFFDPEVNHPLTEGFIPSNDRAITEHNTSYAAGFGFDPTGPNHSLHLEERFPHIYQGQTVAASTPLDREIPFLLNHFYQVRFTEGVEMRDSRTIEASGVIRVITPQIVEVSRPYYENSAVREAIAEAWRTAKQEILQIPAFNHHEVPQQSVHTGNLPPDTQPHPEVRPEDILLNLPANSVMLDPASAEYTRRIAAIDADVTRRRQVQRDVAISQDQATYDALIADLDQFYSHTSNNNNQKPSQSA